MHSNKNKPQETALSVVVPLYNETDSLAELNHEICEVGEHLDGLLEIVFVDDGSTDGSYALLEELHGKDSRVKVLQLRKNFGKSEALAAGFAASTGRLIVTMDADLQDDPAEIPALVKEIESGFDLVSGWKKKRKDPLSKRIPSKLWNRLAGWMTGLRIHDFNCGLKIYRREVVEAVQVYGEMHRYIPALAHWAGFRVGEAVVNHRARKHGKTKYGPWRFLSGILDLMTVMFLSKYTRRPLHLFGLIGMISSLAGGAITLYLVVLRLFKASYLSNRPLLFIGVLLLIVGVQFISIGLLGEMMTRSQDRNHEYAIRKSLGV